MPPSASSPTPAMPSWCGRRTFPTGWPRHQAGPGALQPAPGAAPLLPQKPEYEYNLDLVRRFLADQHQTVVEPQGPYLDFDPESLLQVREQVAARLRLDASRPG